MDKLKFGAILSYIVLGLNLILGLAYMPYMIRMLGQNEYGIYALATSVIAYLTLLDLGFSNTVIRYTAKYRSENNSDDQYRLFGVFTLIYAVLGIVTMIVGVFLYYHVEAMFGRTLTIEELDRTRSIMLLLVFNVAITFPLSIFGAIITAYEKFVFQRVVTIVRLLLNAAVMICLLSFGYKALAMVVVQTLFNVVSLLLNLGYCLRRIKIRVRFDNIKWSVFKEIGVYSFWVFLSLIAERIYWSTGQIILGATVGLIAVSVFSLAMQLQGMYLLFSTAISGLFLPRVTAMVTQKCNDKELSELFIRVGRLQFIVMAFILCGFIIFGRSFINLWVGPSYSDAYTISILLLVPLTVPLIQSLGFVILLAKNQMRFRSLLYVVIAIGSLALQLFLAKTYQGIGCAASIAIGIVIGHGIIMNFYYAVVHHIDIKKFWFEIAKMAVIPIIISFLTLLILQNMEFNTLLELLVAIILFAVVYIPIFWTVSMNQYERELLCVPAKMLGKQCRKRLKFIK